MNDTLTVNAIVPANITGDDLDGTARSFPRVASKSLNDVSRQSLHVNSLSPTVLRVAQTPRSSKNPQQRSLFELKQVRARLDAQSNPISYDESKVGTTLTLTPGVTLAEARVDYALHVGAMMANNMALFDELYNGAL